MIILSQICSWQLLHIDCHHQLKIKTLIKVDLIKFCNGHYFAKGGPDPAS